VRLDVALDSIVAWYDACERSADVRDLTISQIARLTAG
jgi:hypothetical protein